MGRKIKRLFFGFSVFFTVMIFITMFTPFPNLLARSLVMEPTLKKADVIVVLGGGGYPNNTLSSLSNERFLRAFLLYRKGFAPNIMFVGGSLVTRTKKGFHTLMESSEVKPDVIEAVIMRDIAISLGIPEKAIFIETTTTHTYSNLKTVKEFMEAQRLKNCLLVTSPTHIKRVWLAAEKLKMDCAPAPVDDYTPYMFITGERLKLMRDVLWEYVGLIVYKIYGYI